MRLRLLFTTALLSLFWSFAAANADPSREITRYDQHVYGTQDGVPQAMINALAQTPDGYLWIGTEGGLGRFDGRRFTTFRSENTPALRIHRVRTLRVDGAGALWVGTKGGAGLVRYQDGVFETFEDKIGKGGAFVVSFEDRKGNLWFCSPAGLLRFQNGHFDLLETLDGVPLADGLAMAEDGDGGLWLATLTSVLRIKDHKVQRFEGRLPASSLPIGAMVADAQGVVWMGDALGGLLSYQAGELTRIIAADSMAKLGAVLSLLVDGQGALWGATNGGLARLNEGKWDPVALRSDEQATPAALLEDHDANIWIGTQTQGLLRITRAAFKSLPNPQSFGSQAASVGVGRSGSLWVGSDGSGAARYDFDTRTFHAVPNMPGCPQRVWAIAEDAAGRLWLGGERSQHAGLCRIDLKTLQMTSFSKEHGFANLATRSLLLEEDGSLLVGTHDGLYRIAEDTASLMYRQGTSYFDVFAVYRDRAGTLWLGVSGESGGLYNFDGRRWTRIHLGLSNAAVHSIDEGRDGALWLGTLSGFSRYKNGVVSGWRHAQGLFDDPVFKVLSDAQGNLWLCSPRGVFRIDQTAIEAFDKMSARLSHTHFGSPDGLASDQCGGGYGQHAALATEAGGLWFPSGRTVATIDSSKFRPPSPSTRPVIESVVYDGSLVNTQALLALPPGRGNLDISYTLPWLSQPQRLRFFYRLDPFDLDWVEAAERRVALYTQVPPGAYTFRVTYETVGSEKRGEMVSLPLTILPHTYETWWFRGLVVAAVLSLTALLLRLWHRRRVEIIQGRHQAVLAERARMARDLHDTLAQGFTGISVQLEAATGWMEQSPQRARENIDKARSLVRSSLVDARRAVWDLRPESVEQGGLVQAFSNMARSLSAQVVVRMQVNGRPFPLPEVLETGLLRIGQEALTNAVRHARATNISLTITFGDGCVHLRVLDDGRGFEATDKSQTPGHLGLEGIKSRAHQLKAELRIESRPGEGTEVILLAPIPKQRETN